MWTKGPWRASREYVFAGKNCIAICDTDNASLNRYENNARMMASSLEMYEAMQEFIDRCDKGEIRSKKTCAQFKQILAKARGEDV